MSQLLNTLRGLLKAPFSGNVNQSISPTTSWLSPQLEFNFAGDHRVEAEVVADVASYGRQLGILSAAVLELANGEQGEAVADLKNLTEQIEKVKHQHQDKLEHKVKAGLDQLKKQDPESLQRLLYEYR